MEDQKLPYEHVTLLIGVPSQAEWSAEFGLSLAFLVHGLTCNLIKFHIQNVRGSILPQLRQNIVDFAVENKASHLLFVDSDQSFEPTIIQKWLDQTERQVIAANIATKGMPSYPTAKTMVGGMPVPHYSDTAPDRYTKVGRVGTGLMMIQRDTLVKLPRPAFLPGWHEGEGQYVGEDWTLCAHLDELGVPIWVDNAASQMVGHHGVMKFGWDHIKATRLAEEKQHDTGRDSKSRIVTAR